MEDKKIDDKPPESFAAANSDFLVIMAAGVAVELLHYPAIVWWIFAGMWLVGSWAHKPVRPSNNVAKPPSKPWSDEAKGWMIAGVLGAGCGVAVLVDVLRR